MMNLPLNSTIGSNPILHEGNHDNRGIPHEQYINKWNLTTTVNNKEATNKFIRFATIEYEADNNVGNIYLIDCINHKNQETTEIRINLGVSQSVKYVHNSEFQILYTLTSNTQNTKPVHKLDLYIKVYKSYNPFFFRLKVAKNNEVWNYENDYAYNTIKMLSNEPMLDTIENSIIATDLTPTNKHHIFRTSWGTVPVGAGATYTIRITNSEIKWDSVVSVNFTSEMPNGLATSTSIKSGGGELYYKITNVTSNQIQLPNTNIVYTITQF